MATWITLCDLATQTSGLPRLPPGLFRRSLRRRRDPYAGFSERDLLHAVAKTRRKGTPGVRLRYSNFGFGLLGYVLARRAETSYDKPVRPRSVPSSPNSRVMSFRYTLVESEISSSKLPIYSTEFRDGPSPDDAARC